MSSVLGIERRRTGSIGIEETTLSALEKFVELCDKGCPEEDELDNGDNENTTPATKENPESLANEPYKAESKSIEDLRRSGSSSAQAKLSELFIDRKLRSPRHSVSPSPLGSTEDNSNSSNGTLKSGTNNGTSTTNQPIKKSEEIWVRRAAGGRRSFRVTVSSMHSSSCQILCKIDALLFRMFS